MKFMAADRLLDVWIVDLKKVYTGVPFTVVTDWLQEGRLLASDCVRLAGKAKWHPVEKVPALAPYLPRQQKAAAEDRAEALEPIDLGFQSAKVREEEDDDVDMIPLIDVSLVLLIFFMMTTAIAAGVFSSIPTPTARHQLTSVGSDMFWIGIEIDKDDKSTPRYSLGKDTQKRYLVGPTEGAEVLAELAKELETESGEIKIRLRADKSLPIETIKGLTLDLQDLEARLNRARPATQGKLQLVILGEVSEPTK
jgi:biopolymer transport protein ExbD